MVLCDKLAVSMDFCMFMLSSSTTMVAIMLAKGLPFGLFLIIVKAKFESRFYKSVTIDSFRKIDDIEVASVLQCCQYCMKHEFCEGVMHHESTCKALEFVRIDTNGADKALMDVGLLGCPNGWTKISLTCYLITDEKLNFEESLLTCNNMGGKLVEPKSEEQNKIVYDYVERKLGNIVEFYIGIFHDDNQNE